jgi:hypothetical protein
MKNTFKKIQENISEEILKKDKNSIVDGIINFEKYAEATTKILWVLKEANSSDSDWTYQDFLSVNDIESRMGKTKDTLKGPLMFKKVFYATYGLIMNEEYSVLPDVTEKAVYQIGEEIAYINIKKVGGGPDSDPKEIEQAYKNNEDLLLKQIKEYSPNIIIFGNTLNYFDRDKLKEIGWDFSENKHIVDETTNNTHFYPISNEKLCIYPYHPSARINREVYCTEIIKAGMQWRELNN